MKKRELEGQVGKIMLSARADRARLDYVYTVVEQLEARLEKLEATVGEELPRLFTRIEELERVRIELEAGMAILSEGEPNEDKSSITPNIPTCQSEGDKARQPGFTPHEVAICDTCQTPVLPGEWCACGVQYDPKARQPEHTGAIVCPKCGAYGDALRTKRCQPDEPMADMPETGPSDRSLLAAEVDMMRDYRDEALDQRDKAWAERDQARAERDELAKALENQRLAWEETLEEQVAVVRAERDKLGEFHRANVEGRVKAEAELDRLREGIERLARQYDKWGAENVAHNLRALLDGDDE